MVKTPPAKQATTSVPLSEPVASRWSPQAFSSRPLERDTILRLLEAVRWAPSSRNLQPWSLIVTLRDQPSHPRLHACLSERNQRWAGVAPLLLLMVTATENEPDKPNRMAYHDAGIAFGVLAVEASTQGLAVHPMGGFDKERARDEFEIPAGLDPVIAIAVGYPGEPQDLPEEFRARETGPRTRKPLDEMVFTDRWGSPAPLVAG